MLLHTVTQLSLDLFRQESAGKKIVLIYPWTNCRNLLLEHFLAQAEEGEGLLYYRISDGQTALHDWLAGLVEEFQAVLANFGSQLQAALVEGTPAELGEALAADLGSYSQEPLILFIDDFDRVIIDADFNQFAAALVDNLPDGVQIAFSSRLLSSPLWSDMVARGKAVVLGTDQRKEAMRFKLEPKPKPQLEVYAFGRGRALVNGQPIINWDGALPRNLFFFFMDHPLVTRDEVFETFWPSMSIKDATNVFHVTKRKISERIGMRIADNGNYELTHYGSGFYMPSDKIVRHYDVSDFEEAVEKALVVRSEKEEIALLSRAIDLYRESFLQTVEMKWAVERRDTLRRLYAQALIGMGRIYNRRGEDHRAIGFFTSALKETPEREDIQREVMSLYEKTGMLDDAVKQYRALEHMLHDTLKIPPSRETREVYERIDSKRR